MGFQGVLCMSFLTIAETFITMSLKYSISIENSCFVMGVIFFNAVKVNLQTRYHVQVFNTLQHIEVKKNEQNELVSQLLPYHVINLFYSI